MSYKVDIENMTFSFSRANTAETCLYAFYKKYIEGEVGESNFYASNGRAMHEVFEELFNNKITIDECPHAYNQKFDLICERVKSSIMENTYIKCIDYLCEMDDIDRDKYEIIGVEMKLVFKIGDIDFQGYADLVVRNRKTGEVILVDHKQATRFMKKDGVTPLKNQLANFLAYKKQMYCYCKGLLEQHGIKVDKLAWHHFKDGGEITLIPFNQQEMDESLQWVIDTVEKIKIEEDFEPTQSYMMCKQLCDFRNSCEYQET